MAPQPHGFLRDSDLIGKDCHLGQHTLLVDLGGKRVERLADAFQQPFLVFFDGLRRAFFDLADDTEDRLRA